MDSFIPFILVFEAGLEISECPNCPNVVKFAVASRSGWSDDPKDAGGATMCGVTLETYRSYCKLKGYPSPSKNDLRNISFTHWRDVLKSLFWDKCRASEFKTPSVAHLVVDWVWASGPKVIRRVQRILGVNDDGIIGPKTVAAINAAVQPDLFSAIKADRFKYINEICAANPRNEHWRKGWTNRLNAIRFDKLVLHNPPEPYL